MSKHTPGPWDTDEKDHDEPYQDIRVRAGKRVICRVCIDDTPDRDYNAEQYANARLIVATPKLLKALKQSLAAMERDWYEMDQEWGPTVEKFGDLEGAIRQRHKSTDAIRSARATIAEAEGHHD